MTIPDQDVVTPEGLKRYISRIADELGISQSVAQILMEQADRLGELYGNSINRMEAIKVIAHQLELTKTGLIKEPVTIEEFVTSPEYMNQGDYVRPRIMDHLSRLFDPKNDFIEVVLGGAIGIGKNYFCDMAVAYLLYKMSCLFSPQTHYGLAPGSDIVFVHQSKTLDLAKKVVFSQFTARINASGYFPRTFMYSQARRTELRFPSNIILRPISSSDTAALGMNIYAAVIDEMNFMSRIKRAKKNQHLNEEEYDQAEKLYNVIYTRIDSRYAKLGRVPGKIFLISSANYANDFIDRKEEEAKTNPRIFVMHMNHWEAMPPGKYGKQRFWVMLPTDQASGYIMDGKPDDMTGAIEVPLEERYKFEKDLEASLRDLAGIPIVRRSKFLPADKMTQAVKNYEYIYRSKTDQLFSLPAVNINQMNVQALINKQFLAGIASQGPFSAHIDLALSECSAGIAIAQVLGRKNVGTKTEYNEEKKKFETTAYSELPVYGVAGVLQVIPPPDGEISLNKVRDLMFALNDLLDLKWVTLDQFQSASILQSLRSRGIAAGLLQIDKKPEVYNEFKISVNEGRLYVPEHTTLLMEVRHLERDNANGKVDHVDGQSKDVSDAVAGSVYTLSVKKSSYRKTNTPTPFVFGPDLTTRYIRPVGPVRPSSGRDPIY